MLEVSTNHVPHTQDDLSVSYEIHILLFINIEFKSYFLVESLTLKNINNGEKSEFHISLFD